MIAGAAADQDQRAQRQEIGVDRPGQSSGAGTEIMPKGRQRHVDDRTVDEGDAGSQNGRSQRGTWMRMNLSPRCSRDAAVARADKRCGHATPGLRN